MAQGSGFESYDRIQDTLMFLSNDLVLSFVCTLSWANRQNHRRFFHYESEYASKYSDVSKARSIRRSMVFYYLLENRNDFLGALILKPQDVQMLLMGIESKVLPWFFSKRIFATIDDRLYIKESFSSVIYPQTENKYLKFDPIVMSYDNNTYKEGVRIYVNSESVYADMELDKFLGLYYILKNTDMYAVASSMINYVKIPPYGIGLHDSTGLGGGGDYWSNTENESDVKSASEELYSKKETRNLFLDQAKRTTKEE